MAALTTKIKASNAILNEQEIGNALYGLQNMGCDTQEVRALLTALTTKIKASNAILDAQAIGNALYGLQNMSSDTQEVRDLLAASTTKIKASNTILDAQHIGNALYGLQNMGCDTQEVYDVLNAIECKFPQTFITFNDNKLEWCQAASAYLQLAQNSTDKTLTLTTVNRLFPEHNNNTQKLTFPIDEIKSIFVNTLKSMQLQNSKLNLHELDTLSARLLLNDLVTNQSYPSRIIYGRGSHSKISIGIRWLNLSKTI